MSAELIWAPPAERRDASLLSRFAAQYRPQASSYAELHSWSLRAPGAVSYTHLTLPTIYSV